MEMLEELHVEELSVNEVSNIGGGWAWLARGLILVALDDLDHFYNGFVDGYNGNYNPR